MSNAEQIEDARLAELSALSAKATPGEFSSWPDHYAIKVCRSGMPALTIALTSTGSGAEKANATFLAAAGICRDGHAEIRHETDEERCPVCLERDRAADLWIALEQALEAMNAVSVFVTSGEKIKQPEGAEFWAGEMQHAREALERHRAALMMEDGR